MARAQDQGELSALREPLAELALFLSKRSRQEAADAAQRKSDAGDEMISASRRALEQRRASIKRKIRKHREDAGQEKIPEGEVLSVISTWTRTIPLADVKIDKKFKDSRIHEDPLHPEWYANEGQSISDLMETMQGEGLKIPIVVLGIEEKGREVFLLRAGGRRRKAALRLGWTSIPAIVLPEDMPPQMQYWYNILENSGRKNLTTYELAMKILHMSTEFDVSIGEFAKKTGYSPSYVGNLLGCAKRLPQYLLEQWRDGARVALDQWISLSHLDPEEAIRQYHRMVGMTPKDRLKIATTGKRRMLPPARWVSRMQRLYVGIEGSDLPPRTRDLVLRSIEVCMGQYDDIPGIYEPKKQKKYEAKARLRAELALPELPDPGEEKEAPPPMLEVPK